MIRPLTFVCLLAAFGAGLYLYGEKHRAILLDGEIGRAIHGTEAARERTGLLRAEWALLNDPGRLQTMSDKYLALKPMAPGQFVQLTELSTRLPPPGQPGGSDDVVAGDAPAVAPAPAPQVPAVVAAVAPVPVHAPPKQVARAAPRKAAHPVTVADREPPLPGTPLPRATMLPLAGLPTRARVMSAMARPSSASAARPAVMTASARAIAPYVGSALAGGGGLPPPVPLP